MKGGRRETIAAGTTKGRQTNNVVKISSQNDGKYQAVADSGATMSVVTETQQLASKRRSNTRVLDYTGGNTKTMDYDGTVNLFMFHPDDNSHGVSMTMEASTMAGIQNNILSISKIVKGMGFNCEFHPDGEGWEGFTRICKRTGRIEKIPLVYSKRRRLWFVNYTTGKTPELAKSKAGRSKSNRRRQSVDAIGNLASAAPPSLWVCEMSL